MSQLEKLKRKFYSKPVRNDMTFDEIEKLAKAYGCIVKTGGRHSFHVAHLATGTVIPIPRHGDTVKEAYHPYLFYFIKGLLVIHLLHDRGGFLTN